MVSTAGHITSPRGACNGSSAEAREPAARLCASLVLPVVFAHAAHDPSALSGLSHGRSSLVPEATWGCHGLTHFGEAADGRGR